MTRHLLASLPAALCLAACAGMQAPRTADSPSLDELAHIRNFTSAERAGCPVTAGQAGDVGILGSRLVSFGSGIPYGIATSGVLPYAGRFGAFTFASPIVVAPVPAKCHLL